jgi:hypothetical protein
LPTTEGFVSKPWSRKVIASVVILLCVVSHWSGRRARTAEKR